MEFDTLLDMSYRNKLQVEVRLVNGDIVNGYVSSGIMTSKYGDILLDDDICFRDPSYDIPKSDVIVMKNTICSIRTYKDDAKWRSVLINYYGKE